MVEIQKGIEIPPPSFGGRPTKYPIKKMEIGDSFVVDKSERNGMGGYFRNLGFKCTTRNVVEDGKEVVRVWRIA